MPVEDQNYSPMTDFSHSLATLAGLPSQLPGDSKRQAVPSFYGDHYQAWWSIDAWLRLPDANQVIYLEDAEDFDLATAQDATAVQVKAHKDPISLNNAKAHEALHNFWSISTKEAYRQVNFHYLTTSPINQERGDPFGGIPGIEVWRAAQTRDDMAGKIAAYLVEKLEATEPLRLFLETATADRVQARLICRFHWLTDQPDLDTVKRSVDDRIVTLLGQMNQPVCLSEAVREKLCSKFWDIFLQPDPEHRRLTRAELLRQVSSATTTLVPVPTDRLHSFLTPPTPGLALFNALLETPPVPPGPLLSRDQLTRQVVQFLEQRRPVLLTGTVRKGKTTISQLVIHSLCPLAWWLGLSGRSATQSADIIRVLAQRIDRADCPALIVIDDLDICPTAQVAYRDALALAVHRAVSTGRGLLLTARGDSAYLTYAHGLTGIATVEVTQIDAEEAVRMCLDHGCPASLAHAWGTITAALTGGHPKLVQVRLAELAKRGWPALNAADLLDPSPAVTAARALARRLLSESLSPPMVEFVYILSESLVPLRRHTGILVAEAVEGISNAGDVIDDLIGTWIEYVEDGRLRVTRLLNGVVGDVWSPEKRRLAHLCLHDALLNQRTVTPLEAAALLFHAWRAENSERLARHARTLSTLLDDRATQQVDLRLQWLPLIALNVEQSITPDPVINIMLRYLQFRVATTLESDQLPSICARWIDDVGRIVETDARDRMSVLVWMAIGSAASEKIPMIHRLRAANGISYLPAAIYAPSAEFRKAMTKNFASIGLPTQATTAQVFILFAIRSVDSFDELASLLRWLDQDASDKLRREFDEMLVWPIVQTMGAFVHTAWVKVCQTTKDWAPWLDLFARLDDYAQRHTSPCLGREVAKARAMILTEYLDDGNLALQVLEGAETAFGSSAVLTEQRANVLYQIKDDEAALRIWEDVVGNPDSHFVINAFAYRRTALSAVRLKRWDIAERLFLEGAAWNDAAQSDIVRFGLRLDAALAASNGGFQNRASRHLLQAILGLPVQASVDEDARWEAVQRAASAICVAINNRAWNPTEHDCAIEVGFASAPDSRVPETAPGQSVRTEITKALALHLAATLTTVPDEATSLLNDGAASRVPLVRLLAAESRLSVVYARGAASDLITALIEFNRSLAWCLAQTESAGTLLIPIEQVGR